MSLAKNKMKFKEIVSRITGISIPIFGIQWSPSEIEITKAKRIITFLEDRRVLYAPDKMEVPEHCVESVLRIREFLTKELSDIDSTSELSKNLRSMRAACRRFLDEISTDKDSLIIIYARSSGHWGSWKFYGDLGQMRGVFGLHIALIAASYGLDVEDNLAKILPDIDTHEEDGITKLRLK